MTEGDGLRATVHHRVKFFSIIKLHAAPGIIIIEVPEKFIKFMKANSLLLSLLTAIFIAVFIAFRAQANPGGSPDTVSSTLWWKMAIYNQINLTQERHYQGCIWGDSISSALTNSLGEQYFNFAIGGMSSVSLLEQLNLLKPNHFQCEKAIVAIGTNDAMYAISDEAFVNNMKEAIALMRSMGIQKIILIPAFYSTVAASYKPDFAGTLTRVDEINALINQVAMSEKVAIEPQGIQALYQDGALNETLTIDGVHLNEKGLDIYRKVLLNILNSTPVTPPSSATPQPPVKLPNCR